MRSWTASSRGSCQSIQSWTASSWTVPYAKRTKKFPQVAHWCVDYFHGAKHSDRCPCNPHHVRRLARRFADVNTSAAEQVFSWFRQYARVRNELSPHRHQMKVLLFCKLHNDLCRDGRPGYLSQFPYKRKKVSKSYSCSKKCPKNATKCPKTAPKKRPATKCPKTAPKKRLARRV